MKTTPGKKKISIYWAMSKHVQRFLCSQNYLNSTDFTLPNFAIPDTFFAKKSLTYV